MSKRSNPGIKRFLEAHDTQAEEISAYYTQGHHPAEVFHRALLEWLGGWPEEEHGPDPGPGFVRQTWWRLTPVHTGSRIHEAIPRNRGASPVTLLDLHLYQSYRSLPNCIQQNRQRVQKHFEQGSCCTETHPCSFTQGTLDLIREQVQRLEQIRTVTGAL